MNLTDEEKQEVSDLVASLALRASIARMPKEFWGNSKHNTTVDRLDVLLSKAGFPPSAVATADPHHNQEG